MTASPVSSDAPWRRKPRILGPAPTRPPRPGPAPSKPKRRWARRIGGAVGVLVLAVAVTLTGFLVAAKLRETRTAEALAPSTGQFVETGHGRMFVQDAGPRDAMPIVLIHGTAAWSEFWRGTIAHLVAKGHRVVALDLPPFGFSARSAEGAYTRRDQARRIIGALDQLRIERAILVGHSFGAGATVETAMLAPDRVAGLVLVAAALGLAEDGAAPAMPPKLLATFLDLPVLPETVVAATLTNPLLTRTLLSTMIARKEAATEELAEVLRRPMTRTGTTRDFVSWLKGFLTPDLGAASMAPANFAKLAMPTRLIWGDRDTLTPPPQGQRLARLIPGASLTMLGGLGHIPQIEGPVEFRRALEEALGAVAPRR